jgi:hypothetical protein
MVHRSGATACQTSLRLCYFSHTNLNGSEFAGGSVWVDNCFFPGEVPVMPGGFATTGVQVNFTTICGGVADLRHVIDINLSGSADTEAAADPSEWALGAFNASDFVEASVDVASAEFATALEETDQLRWSRGVAADGHCGAVIGFPGADGRRGAEPQRTLFDERVALGRVTLQNRPLFR